MGPHGNPVVGVTKNSTAQCQQCRFSCAASPHISQAYCQKKTGRPTFMKGRLTHFFLPARRLAGFNINRIDFLKLSVATYKEQGGQPVVEYSRFQDGGIMEECLKTTKSREKQ